VDAEMADNEKGPGRGYSAVTWGQRRCDLHSQRPWYQGTGGWRWGHAEQQPERKNGKCCYEMHI